MTDREISTKEAGKRLGLTQHTIRKYVKNGTLKGYRVGTKLIRIPESELENLKKLVSQESNGKKERAENVAS